MNSHVKFNNINTFFSKALREKIQNYFIVTSKDKTGGRKLYLKSAILLASLVTLYSILVFIHPHWIVGVSMCILLGINFAAIGFNIMHDAGHNSFSKNSRVNSIFSYSLNLLGGNIYFWKLKHNIAHHTYTNIEGEDHDIEIKFMRIHPDQEIKKHHRYQKFYFLILYGISYFAWVFYQDYEKYFRQKMSKNSPIFNFPLKERIIFWISKIIHLIIFLIIPILHVGLFPTLVGISISYIVCGVCLAVVFQLAHVVESTQFKTIEAHKVEDEWMIHQIQSTANFATKNKFLSWLLGGLNFQVEHHLFPKISHVHYPAINKIVKETCDQFSVKYAEYETLGGAFISHVKVIERMSK
ncbi:fatty acid desaturase family protein [Sphingobacterium hungaricum]|uniref:Acyl-CoA desaturase n=1 Tax=Sphingobacterium hungaricum TaxID=2082723 RepID=A0A928UTN8_9SPHI|nr:acyl-CoA desaturase [Sphingobacterium hungaricum]MBE8712673.1 acyl-CoA desaturase [Sphingobacterium hungaricum]